MQTGRRRTGFPGLGLLLCWAVTPCTAAAQEAEERPPWDQPEAPADAQPSPTPTEFLDPAPVLPPAPEAPPQLTPPLQPMVPLPPRVTPESAAPLPPAAGPVAPDAPVPPFAPAAPLPPGIAPSGPQALLVPAPQLEQAMASLRRRGFAESEILLACHEAIRLNVRRGAQLEALAAWRRLNLPEEGMRAFVDSGESLTDHYNTRYIGGPNKITAGSVLLGGATLTGVLTFGLLKDEPDNVATVTAALLGTALTLGLGAPGTALTIGGIREFSRWAPEHLLELGHVQELRPFAFPESKPRRVSSPELGGVVPSAVAPLPVPPPVPAPSPEVGTARQAEAPPVLSPPAQSVPLPAPAEPLPVPAEPLPVPADQLAYSLEATVEQQRRQAVEHLYRRGFSEAQIRRAFADADQLNWRTGAQVEQLAVYRHLGLPGDELKDFADSGLSLESHYNQRLGGPRQIAWGSVMLGAGLATGLYAWQRPEYEGDGDDRTVLLVGSGIAAAVGPLMILNGKSKTDRWALDGQFDTATVEQLAPFVLDGERESIDRAPLPQPQPAGVSAVLAPFPVSGGGGLQVVGTF